MRLRRITSICLAVVGAVAAVLGIVLAVSDRSLFDEQEVERTTVVVVADRDVKRLLAREITDRALEYGEFEDYREQISDFVVGVLDDEDVEGLVTDAVMVSYRSLVVGDDAIEFNPVSLAAQVRRPLVTVLPFLDDELPPEDELLRFELFDRSELPGIYDWVDTIRTAAWWVLVAGIVCLVAALAVGPGRFGVFAIAAGTAVVTMFVTATWIQTATDNAIDGVDDDLTRRVAHLATDEYLADMNDVAAGVVIFGIIAVIAGIGGTWLRNTIRPPKPHTVAR